MKTDTTNRESRSARFLGAILILALMVPVAAFAQAPAVPTLSSPTTGSIGISTSPTLIWGVVATANTYELQIATAADCLSGVVYDDATLTSASNVVTGLVNSQTYYWRVSATKTVAPAGTSAFSSISSFTCWTNTPTTPHQLPVALGAAGRFAVLSATGITNNATATSITGDVGETATGAYMTGFDYVTVAGGLIYSFDGVGPLPTNSQPTFQPNSSTLLNQAMGDLTTAYNDAAGRPTPIPISGNLAGRTLYAGLYKCDAILGVTGGDVYLDPQGDENAVWIFQVGSGFNMTLGRVMLTSPAKAANVFWQVGSGATFGTTCVMEGTIMAYTACTFASGAVLHGRALARTANVTMQGNTIVRPPIPTGYINPTTVDLATAASFKVLTPTTATIAFGCTITGNVGAPTLSNSGTVNGDVWYNTGPGGGSINGAQNAVGSTVSTAITDLGNAIGVASGLTPNTPQLNPQLGGTTLGRGIYISTDGTFAITTGSLILSGSAIDIFIFQMTSTLNTGDNCNVILTGGAVWGNVFWQVGSAATLGANSVFQGNIMAGTGAITQGIGTSIDGRALAHTLAVTLNGTSILPVELVSFAATTSGLNAQLRWSTATEVNNYGFEIQRRSVESGSVAEWQKAGFVPGAGTSSSPRQYSYTDRGLTQGQYAYRIKQIDKNGSFKYSATTQVDVGSVAKEFSLSQSYPNPFNPSTTVEFSVAQNDRAVVKVFNVLGQEVATIFDGTAEAGKMYQARFDASRMSSGMYYVRLQSNGQAKMQKIVFLK